MAIRPSVLIKTAMLVVFSASANACGEKTEAALTDEQESRSVPPISNAKVPVIKVGETPPVAQEPPVAKRPTQFAAKSPALPEISAKPNPAPVRQGPFTVKRCMNLGNALEAESEGAWGYSIRRRDFTTIASAGFDTVRIPVRWDLRTSRRAPYKIDDAYMGRVQQVVGQAQSAGLGVILDVHHYESLMTNTDREQARFLSIWNQISTVFAGAPSNVYFEILNEPTNEMSMARLNQLYSAVIPVIRKTNPSRKLIIGGNSWNAVDRMKSVAWPRDPNIVATYHDYGPHEFTHQGAEWSTPVMPLGRKWGGKSDQKEIKETFKIAMDFKRRSGLPVLVGEFGVIDKVPLAERMQWMKVRRQSMEQNGLPWCAWDFSGAFKTYDMQNERWYPGVLDALFGR